MKKAILFIVGLILLSIITNANGDQNQPKPLKAEPGTCYGEGTRLLNVGVGFWGNGYYRGYHGYRGYTSRVLPYFTLSYEQALTKKAGPGFIGLGAYLGYKSAVYRYDDRDGIFGGSGYYYEHKYRNFVIAARAVYHWDELNFKNAEIYGGLIAGLRFQTYSFESKLPDNYRGDYRYSGGNVWGTWSLFAGARWYFVPKAALYAELGYGVSILNAGITFKL